MQIRESQTGSRYSWTNESELIAEARKNNLNKSFDLIGEEIICYIGY